MKKIVKIDYNPGRLMSIAVEKLDAGDLIEAIKLLRLCEEKNGGGKVLYSLFADAYYKLDVLNKAIFYWYKCLDVYPTFYDRLFDEFDQRVAYRGLADCYSKQENHAIAAYYAQLCDDDTDAKAIEKCELLQKGVEFLKRIGPRIVYPPKSVDCERIVDRGFDLMRSYKYDEAIRELLKVEYGNKLYAKARNYIVMCCMVQKKYQQALVVCEDLISKCPDSFMALATKADIKIQEQGGKEEATKIAKKLIEIQPSNSDEIYKLAHICALCNMDEEAYEYFRQIDKTLGNSKTQLYTRAVSAFNCQKIDEAFKIINKLEILYPEAIIAKINFAEVKHNLSIGKEVKKISYMYALSDENEKDMHRIKDWYFYELRPFDIKIIKNEIETCIQWSLDSIFLDDPVEIKKAGLATAVRLDTINYVRDALLDNTIPDEIKPIVIGFLVDMNIYGEYGVVMNDMYRKVLIRHIKTGKKKREDFIEAYTKLMIDFGVLNDKNSIKLSNTCEKVYEKLKSINALEMLDNIALIQAVIYCKSGVRGKDITKPKVAKYFSVDKNKLESVLGVL